MSLSGFELRLAPHCYLSFPFPHVSLLLRASSATTLLAMRGLKLEPRACHPSTFPLSYVCAMSSVWPRDKDTLVFGEYMQCTHMCSEGGLKPGL